MKKTPESREDSRSLLLEKFAELSECASKAEPEQKVKCIYAMLDIYKILYR